MAFEEIQKKGRRPSLKKRPMVAVASWGIYLNELAYSQIGNAEKVSVQIDREGKRIRLMASNDGFPVKVYKRDKIFCGARIHLRGILQMLGLDEFTRHPEIEATADGGLILKL